MKHIKLAAGFLAVLCAALVIYFVLSSENALVTNPKGIIAKSELKLIATNYLLMLIVVVPTLIALFVIAWKYRAKNTKAKYQPEHKHTVFSEVLLWVIPSLVIAVMAIITWKATHELDPYRPINGDVKPLTIQVVALDWKWLFIYPEQGIAAVNYVQFPSETPIHLDLAADGSPLNSFWLPELSGQIYCMQGMSSQLHIMADKAGEYRGSAAEINGKGLADMTFVAKATTPSDFETWVAQVKRSSHPLTDPVYQELLKPSQNNSVALYSSVEGNLYHKILMKYVKP